MERSIIIILLLACLVTLVFALDDSHSEEPLADTVRTLKGQVDALLERRQEDYKLLEDSLRKSLEKNSELSMLKAEVVNLRREVETLRSPTSSGSSNRQKNDHLTVQWLSSAVTELRAELTEVAASYNASAELQQRQESRSAMSLIRGDVASCRRDLEELEAGQQKEAATLAQMVQDMAAVRAHTQTVAAACSDTKTQLEMAQSDWSATLRYLRKSSANKSLFKNTRKLKMAEELMDNTVEMMAAPHTADDRKFRHHRVLRKQVEDLETTTREMRTNQGHLEHQLHRLEKQMKTLTYNHHGTASNNQASGAMDTLQERVANLEASSRTASKSMFNISRQIVGMDKLHLSMLQLLESVETLENKVDHSLPDLQREISKMEFNMAQLTSSVALLKEDQENQRASVKAMGGGISAMQEKLDGDHKRLTAVQTKLLNVTLEDKSDRDHQQDTKLESLEARLRQALLQPTPTVEVETTPIESSNEEDQERLPVSRLVQHLTHIQDEYRQLVHRLPVDCSAVGGTSGLYLISPDHKKPVMTSCDQDTGAGGWTVVQRRVDGSEEFNRRWTEYAAGFGSPSGEFWLGNEALHSLTGENCSSLRVDMRDIYGKVWVAEYSEFSVASVDDGYRLHVAGYQGNASDALEYQNRMQFSSIDSDRDISNTHCAANYEGGWWFSHCQHANLNGRYNLGLTWFDATKNEWIAVSWSEMKVRRREGCNKPVKPHA